MTNPQRRTERTERKKGKEGIAPYTTINPNRENQKKKKYRNNKTKIRCADLSQFLCFPLFCIIITRQKCFCLVAGLPPYLSSPPPSL